MKQRQSFQQMVLEKVDINIQEDLTSFMLIKWKWIIDLNVKHKTIKPARR